MIEKKHLRSSLSCTCGTNDVGRAVSEVVESGGHDVDERAAAR